MDTMIDIDKIEAAAKAATGKQYPELAVVEHWDASNPTTVLEMVALIRKQRDVMQMALEALINPYGVDSLGRSLPFQAIKALEDALE
jgi:hypothetical protein